MPMRRIFGSGNDGSRLMGVNITYEVGVAYDASGGIFVCNAGGSSRDVYSFTSDFAAGIARTLTGATVSLSALAISGSNLFAVGQYASGGSYYQYVFSTQTSLTSEVAERRCSYASNGTSSNRTYAACSDGGTGVYIGGIHASDNTDLMKYTAAGALTWDREIDDTSAVVDSFSVYDICVNASNSNVHIAGGMVRTSDGSSRGCIYTTDSAGSTQWYVELYGTGTTAIKGITTDSSGNCYVALAGTTNCIVKLDTSGAVAASYKINTTLVSDILGIAYLNGGIIAIAKHATSGYVIIRMTTALASVTMTQLVDSSGACTFPRTVKINYYGGFYFFNFGSFGSNLVVAKVSAAVLDSPYYVFGNRFSLTTMTPSTVAFTINTGSGAGLTATSGVASSADPGAISGITSLSAATLTDYYPS